MKAMSNVYEQSFYSYLKETDPLNTQILGLLNFLNFNTFDSLMSVYQKDDATGKWDKLGLNSTKTNTTKTRCN